MADIDFVPIDNGLTFLVTLVCPAFLSGLVTYQTFSYYRDYLNLKDPMSLKFYVFFVWLLDIAHLIAVFLFAYYHTVLCWGDLRVIEHLTWSWSTQFLLNSFLTAFCQFFFIYRVYILSGRNWLLVAILTFFGILQAAMGIWTSVDGLNGQTMRNFLDFNVQADMSANDRLLGIPLGYLLSAAVCDTLIAGTVTWYYKDIRTKWNQGLVEKILFYAAETGALPSILVYWNLALVSPMTLTSSKYPLNTPLDPQFVAYPAQFFTLVISFPLGRAYTHSILLSLNARHGLQNTNMHSWFGNSSPGTPQDVALPTWNSPAREKSKTVTRESESALEIGIELKELPRVKFRTSAAVGDTD
ncbi:hypothetical protein M422DRAFT_273947 [Sphaerobolus stellatus SS14]|uniref:DUF6534 domain-containing protein n=1 Tax=Sphaerobolus stellatus (strain SS14) TaxID=990650 RepID=A0A0C9UIA1_SPHS4|nr:hypothetical protein M422DRAFT_273947 [Sphaerobolus stellatus SS14]